jgi:serine protease Do
LLSIDGHAIPDLKTLAELLNGAKAETFNKEGGDRVRMSLLRSGESIDLDVQLPALSWPRPNESKRCSGFPMAYDADLKLDPHQCGGPVVDSNGCMAGVTIACRAAGLVYVVPSRVVRRFIDSDQTLE